MKVLNNHAPLKKRYIRANNAPFMNSVLCKAIMLRSKLRNNYIKNKTTAARNLYKKQRNYCVSLFRNEKRNFYNNLDTKLFSDNKKFWEHIKPLFSNKTVYNTTIILIEDNEVVSENSKVA